MSLCTLAFIWAPNSQYCLDDLYHISVKQVTSAGKQQYHSANLFESVAVAYKKYLGTARIAVPIKRSVLIR